MEQAVLRSPIGPEWKRIWLVAGREDIRPSHPKASDASDPFSRARQAEVTSLWKLKSA